MGGTLKSSAFRLFLSFLTMTQLGTSRGKTSQLRGRGRGLRWRPWSPSVNKPVPNTWGQVPSSTTVSMARLGMESWRAWLRWEDLPQRRVAPNSWQLRWFWWPAPRVLCPMLSSCPGVSALRFWPGRGHQPSRKRLGAAGGGGGRCPHWARDDGRKGVARESAEGLFLHQPSGGGTMVSINWWGV